MAELRSFIIGVTIAGAVLLVAGLAFGLFSDDSSGAPSVRLLGTPPATRTPAPPATRDPSQFTPVVPTSTPEGPGGATGATGPEGATGAETPPAGETPNPIQTATPTLEVAPTEAPPAATPTPEVNEALAYIDTANVYATGFSAQVDFLAALASAPNVADQGWRESATVSANDVIARAGGLGAIGAPGCVSAAHRALVAAGNQASGAANAVLAGVQAQDAGAVSAATGSLTAASGAIASAIAGVSNAVAGC